MLRSNDDIPKYMGIFFEDWSLSFLPEGNRKRKLSINKDGSFIEEIKATANDNGIGGQIIVSVTAKKFSFPNFFTVIGGGDHVPFRKKSQLKKAQNNARSAGRGLSIREQEIASRRYEFKFPLKWSDRYDHFHTEYPYNNFRLLMLGQKDQDIIFIMQQFGVISQRGNHFLTCQELYKGRLLSKNGLFYIEGHPNLNPERWPKLQEALRDLSSQIKAELSEFRGHPARINVDSLGPKQGIVVHWTDAHHAGMGEILTPEGTARIHWDTSYSENGSKRISFRKGDIVTYEQLTKPINTKGCGHKSSFNLDAIGVRLVKTGAPLQV